MTTVHVAGKANDIVDIPSHSFREDHRCNFLDDCQFLTCFTNHFPLPQGACWQLFVINPKIITLVTSEFQTNQLPMDVWKQLPKIGRIFGMYGAGTQGPST